MEQTLTVVCGLGLLAFVLLGALVTILVDLIRLRRQ